MSSEAVPAENKPLIEAVNMSRKMMPGTEVVVSVSSNLADNRFAVAKYRKVIMAKLIKAGYEEMRDRFDLATDGIKNLLPFFAVAGTFVRLEIDRGGAELPEERKLSVDEVRDRFLNQVEGMTKWWEKADVSNTLQNGKASSELQARLEGLAFSIMSILDGSTVAVPAMIVAPLGCAEDRDYYRQEGEPLWPDNYEIESQIDGDIGGCLHSLIFQKERRRGES